MGINFGNNNISSIHIGGIPVANVYKGNSLVWSSRGEDPLADWNYYLSGDTYVLTGYKGDWANTVYVPIVEGNTVINNYTSGTTTIKSNTPFFNNPNVRSVDLQKVPFVNNSMHNAFYNCENLASVNNINPNVTNMAGTFDSCYNLNQSIQIPNSVTNMIFTFGYCHNLNQSIQIPNSVTSMHNTFHGCHNLNQNIQIGNSVTDMSSTFAVCYNLNQNIQIPNSVTNMYGTFYDCLKLNQNIQIPNSVTNMYSTFYRCQNLNQNIQIPNSVTNMIFTFGYCRKLNQNIQIPNSVTSMSGTFSYCYNLQGTINILSNQITSAGECFNNTSLPKNVYIPFTYSNGVNSATFNSFVSAGYLYANGVSNNQDGVTVYDLNA